MYLGGAVVLFYVTKWSMEWLWGYFNDAEPGELMTTAIAGLVTLIGFIVTYRNDRIHGLANEVASELKKVTWPTAKETRAATIVVIIMSIISALILGFFDLVWSNLTELIYGG